MLSTIPPNGYVVSKAFAASGQSPAEAPRLLEAAARSGAPARLLGVSDEEVLAGTARLAAAAGSAEAAGDYRFGLYFNCLARGQALYQEPGIDAAEIHRALPDVPILGFFCNAEIGPLKGENQLFTYTGVLVLIGENPD